MSWVTIIWAMAASACLTLALLHFLVWFKNRQAWSHLAFTVMTVAVAGVDAVELQVMRARSPAEIAVWLRWLDVPLFVLVAALVGFVRLDFRTGRAGLGWTAVALRLVSLSLNFTTGSTDNYREIQQVRQLDFLGEPVSVVVRAVSNPWGHVSELSMLLLLVFVVDAAVRLARGGSPENRRRAWVVGGSLAGFIFVAAGFSALIENQLIHWPYLISLPFLAIVLVMNYELSREVVHAAQLAGELQERLRFETLLADISSSFVNLPAAEVDREIESAQRRVCEFLRIDLSALWQWTHEVPRYITITHLYRPLGGPPPPARVDGEDMAPWCLRELTAGKIVAVSSMKSPPAAAARDVEVWRHYGIKSALCLPLLTGGQLIGALTFNTVQQERDWPDAAVNRLRLVAQVFANALARNRAEQALRESEERMNLAAEGAGVGLWMLHLNTRRFWLTNKTRELFGFEADEVVTLERFLSQVHPDDQELIRQTVQALRQTSGEGQVEYRVLQRDGSVRWMLSRGRTQNHESGAPDHLTGITVDITERRQAEEKVRQLSFAVEQSPVLVVITDTQGNIVYVNRKFNEVTGFSSEECLGRNPRILKSGESSPSVYEELWAAITAGKTWRGEFHNRKKNGELYWESAVISPLRNPAGSITHFVAVKEDITGRKRTDLELLQQRNQLTHLSRVTMLGELADSLAHELNQPLTSILSNAQAAQRFLAHGQPDLNEMRDILADIVAEDKRAGEVIRRLRLLLKKGEVQRQPLWVNEIVQEVLKLVRSDLVNLNFTAQTELAPNLPVIHGDAVQLQQVLLNLVLNSCDAMAGATRDNRRLTIRTSRADDGSVCLTVADGGTGITPEKIEQVFEPFYTTKASGLGLGLAVCRSIVTAHGGKLWATNNPVHGATFHLTLPVQTDHSR